MKKTAITVWLAVLVSGLTLVLLWFPSERWHNDKAAKVQKPQQSDNKADSGWKPRIANGSFRNQVAFRPVSVNSRDQRVNSGIEECDEVSGGETAVPGNELAADTKDRLNCGVPAAEKEALRALIHAGKKDALAAALGKLLTIAADHHDFKDYRAIFADCKDPEVSAWLAEFMGRTDKADVRDRVRSILVEMRQSEVVNALVEKITHPSDELHAKDSVEALASCRDPSQIKPLKGLLDQDGDDVLQKASALALANIGNAEACKILIERASAADTRAQYCREALAGVSSSYGQETLIQAAGDSALPADVRLAAIRSLSAQKSARVQGLFENLNTSAEEPAVRKEVSKILAETSGSKDVQASSVKTTQEGALVETCF